MKTMFEGEIFNCLFYQQEMSDNASFLPILSAVCLAAAPEFFFNLVEFLQAMKKEKYQKQFPCFVLLAGDTCQGLQIKIPDSSRYTSYLSFPLSLFHPRCNIAFLRWITLLSVVSVQKWWRSNSFSMSRLRFSSRATSSDEIPDSFKSSKHPGITSGSSTGILCSPGSFFFQPDLV